VNFVLKLLSFLQANTDLTVVEASSSVTQLVNLLVFILGEN